LEKIRSFDYIWTADCHGLESIIPFDENVIGAIKMRCSANHGRFPTFGTVCIPQKLYEFVDTLIRREKEGRQIAWFLLAGKKDEKASAILTIMEKGGSEDIIDMAMDGHEFTISKHSDIKIINEYPNMFKNEFFQNVIT